mgnify:CR=1 FL=1
MRPPSANGRNGRDERGRFAKGNPGGPGNPYARRVARLRTALLDAVGDDGIDSIARSLVNAARRGDVAAARLVFSYTLGRPASPVDPDATELHEAELEQALKVIRPPQDVVFSDEDMARIQRYVDSFDRVD